MNTRGEEDSRICDALLERGRDRDQESYVCTVCSCRWSRSFFERANNPMGEIAMHMKFLHPDQTAFMLAATAPWWDWRSPGTATVAKVPPKISNKERGAAVKEAEAILVLARPLTEHLWYGCQCPRCMKVFLSCYDGFEAIFEEGDTPCPADQNGRD